MYELIVGIILIAVGSVFSFFVTSFFVWAIMSLLGYVFTWKIALAVWLILVVVKMMIPKS